MSHNNHSSATISLSSVHPFHVFACIYNDNHHHNFVTAVVLVNFDPEELSGASLATTELTIVRRRESTQLRSKNEYNNTMNTVKRRRLLRKRSSHTTMVRTFFVCEPRFPYGTISASFRRHTPPFALPRLLRPVPLYTTTSVPDSRHRFTAFRPIA